jgi:hypothetical protein
MKTRYNAKTQKYETIDKAAQDKYELTLMGLVLIPLLIVGVVANWGKSYPDPRSGRDANLESRVQELTEARHQACISDSRNTFASCARSGN